MYHRPCWFGGGTGKYALAAGQGGFVAGGAVGFTGLEDEGGLAVEADVFGDGLSVAQVSEEREGDGCDRRSRRGRPAEIGEDKDDSKVAVFAGDFIECHGGLLLLRGWGRLKSRTRVRAYRTHLTSELKVCAGLLFALNVQAAFELFCGIEKQPALFQVA